MKLAVKPWSIRVPDGVSAAANPGTFWPTNEMSQWIFEKFAAPGPTNSLALGLIYLKSDASTRDHGLAALEAALRTLVGLRLTDYGALMAGTFLSVLPIIIVFLLGAKRFISGITAGSVQGV